MSKIIKYEITDKDLQKLQEIYDQTKDKYLDGATTFDDFIKKTIDTAIQSHIQFSHMSEKMLDFLNKNGDFDKTNFDVENVDDFVKNIFSDITNDMGKSKKDSNESSKSNSPKKKIN